MRFLKTLTLGAAIAIAATTAMADKLPLNSISSYLNDLTTAKGEFTQINSDGTISTGTIYIKRPGRVRFEYNAPETGVVVAGSNTVVIYDTKSNQPPETYPLSRTPLSIILQYGNIQMKFTGPTPELRQWIINDGNGTQTTVVLGALQKGGNLPNSLFDVGSPGTAPGR